MTTRTPPLDGIRVLELGEWIAAPYATKLLADLGAAVTKVEWGDGDPTRRWGPFPDGADGDPDRSAMFAYLNSSKQARLIRAGTSPTAVLAQLLPLLRTVDVVVVDQFFLGRLPDAAVDTWPEMFPHLVVATITPFGIDGPRAHRLGYDINCSASSGTAYGVGERDRPPLPVPLSQTEHQGGLALAIALLMALRAKARDGRGQRVDVATSEALASLHTAYFLPRYIFGGGVVGCRNGSEGGIPTYPNTVLPCADGLIAVNSPQVAQWIRFVELMGNPEWTTLPRYRDRRAMASEYKDEVDELVTAFLRQHTKAELFAEFLARRIPCAPVMTGEDLIADEHLRSRGALVDLEFPGGGSCLAPSPPYLFSRSGWTVSRAPRLGEHDDREPGTPRTVLPGPTDSSPPLRGIRVLDLGTAWAGGLAGRFLGDFGADVIKVESWTFMDGSRKGRPIIHGDPASGDEGLWPDLQPGFHVHGRSKRSVAINLKTTEGRDLVLRLARSADVLIHNFPAGVMERLGLDADTLSGANPRLVVAGQCVAGYTGPAASAIGYAGAVAALSGVASATGYEGDRTIGMFQGLHSDAISALTTVFATLAALVERDASGLGQSVEISQWEATMAMSEEVVLGAGVRGVELGPVGFHHALLTPHGNYECLAGDGDPTCAWVSVAVGSDEEWLALIDVIDPMRTNLPTDSESWTPVERATHRAEIDAVITAWTATRDRYDAEVELQSHGVAAAAVQNVCDMLGDPQFAHRGAFVDLDHPLVGNEPMSGLVWHLRRTSGLIETRAPSLGEHTKAVLVDELGLTDDEFEHLVAVGAVEVGPAGPPAAIAANRKENQ